VSWMKRGSGAKKKSDPPPSVRPASNSTLPSPLSHSLAAGATARLTYTLTPKRPLSGSLDSAVVSYTSDSNVKRSAHSTRAGITALSPLQDALRKAMKVGSILSLGVLRTTEQYRSLAIASGVGGAVLGAWAVWRGAGTAVASRKRARALKEVEKMR